MIIDRHKFPIDHTNELTHSITTRQTTTPIANQLANTCKQTHEQAQSKSTRRNRGKKHRPLLESLEVEKALAVIIDMKMLEYYLHQYNYQYLPILLYSLFQINLMMNFVVSL